MGLNVLSWTKDEQRAPLQSLYNTPVTCVSHKHYFWNTPPPILLCVSVVTCAAVRGRALFTVDCLEVTQWPLIPMPYICTCVLSTEKHFVLILWRSGGDVLQKYSDPFIIKEDLLVRAESEMFRVNVCSELFQQSYHDDLHPCRLVLCLLWVNHRVKKPLSDGGLFMRHIWWLSVHWSIPCTYLMCAILGGCLGITHIWYKRVANTHTTIGVGAMLQTLLHFFLYWKKITEH